MNSHSLNIKIEQRPVMMAFYTDIEVEKDEELQFKGEAELDHMDFNQNLFQFKKFFNQINFSNEQRLAITKVTIELTDSVRGLGIAERRPRGGNRFEDNVIVFYEKDRKVVSGHHNRQLHVTASIYNIEQSHTLINPGSSLNIIPLSTLKAVRTLRDRIIRQHVEVSGFGGIASFTFGFINLDLTVGPYEQLTNSMPLMHVPCTICHQRDLDLQIRGCSLHMESVTKAIQKSKKFDINASNCPF